MKLKPLSNRVVIKQDEAPSQTKGGIHLPESAQEKSTMGSILAVGPGNRNDQGDINPMSVKEGDKVCYEKYGGTEVDVDGEKVVVLRESEILAIVE
ncbi:MAG TPA: co-chaperone GroES [Alphaproteobacteria bacterium]|nr:co-chaperone GroES [Alphaproteobacteria bacterium]